MKKYILSTLAVCLVTLLAFSFILGFWNTPVEKAPLMVGFLYAEDASTPNTWNFMQAQADVEEAYGQKISILTKNNVQSREIEEPLRELARKGCDIIFSNVDSDQIGALAAEYPAITFCHAATLGTVQTLFPENYHSFHGEMDAARYVSGIAAGLKLQELIDQGNLATDQPLIGYVAAMDAPEVVSGYTAFLRGVRSIVPNAVMRVHYTGSWSSYSLERKAALSLIQEGCAIIAQHTYTIGPAVACQEMAGSAYHIGFQQNMIDVAPSASLISLRVNWTPYVTGAVEAVLSGRTIESIVEGNVTGRIISAGLERNWVEMLELNQLIAPEGAESQIARAVETFQKGHAIPNAEEDLSPYITIE